MQQGWCPLGNTTGHQTGTGDSLRDRGRSVAQEMQYSGDLQWLDGIKIAQKGSEAAERCERVG